LGTNKHAGAGWRKSRGVDLRQHFCSTQTPFKKLHYNTIKGWTSREHGMRWLRECFEREKANGKYRLLPTISCRNTPDPANLASGRHIEKSFGKNGLL